MFNFDSQDSNVSLLNSAPQHVPLKMNLRGEAPKPEFQVPTLDNLPTSVNTVNPDLVPSWQNGKFEQPKEQMFSMAQVTALLEQQRKDLIEGQKEPTTPKATSEVSIPIAEANEVAQKKQFLTQFHSSKVNQV